MNWKQFQQDKDRLFKKNYARAPIYAKVVTHRVTPYLVYWCMKWGLTPDQVTLISMLVGWGSCFLFAVSSPWVMFLGALGLEVYYIFDSVDGQLARITGKTSKTGAFFDILLNYLVHPFVFIFIGLGHYFVTGQWKYMVLGSVTALSYVWLGLMWNVRAHVLSDAGPLLRKEEMDETKGKSGILKKIFSFLHKLCTFPTVMNLITLSATLQLFKDEFLLGNLLVFYSVVIPFVSLSKMARMILTHELDRESA